MPLPQLSVPKFELELPSTGQKLNYRPFLVKEEKILLMAMEGENEQEIMNAVSHIIDNCITEELDTQILPTFDIEYIFLKLRSKSVNEFAEVSFKCEKCETPNKHNINLEEIEISKTETHSNMIQLDSNIGMQMRYPTTKLMQNINTENREDISHVFDIVENCVEMIFDDDDSYIMDDYTKKEKEEFFNNLTQKQFEKIQEFFTTMPKLQHIINQTCTDCGHEEEITLEGLTNFFG
tara:strand:- start:265 stop:972 length:708 start_codon:yes stop_codon:yes gene_type:complete